MSSGTTSSTDVLRPGAIFSGDPISAADRQGRACQLIDLYLDRLARFRVRYAVWSVHCYSGKMFSEAREVFAAPVNGERLATSTPALPPISDDDVN